MSGRKSLILSARVGMWILEAKRRIYRKTRRSVRIVNLLSGDTRG